MQYLAIQIPGKAVIVTPIRIMKAFKPSEIASPVMSLFNEDPASK
jgi:hypothetical protein